MDILFVKLEDLNPYENNPRNNENAVQYVKNSIREFGFKVPLVIDRNYVIVCGHTRYKAAKEIGLKEVPCIIADNLTEDQIKAFRLADNKTQELAEWDWNKIGIELDSITGIDMADFGFKEDAIKDIFREKKTHICPKCGYEWRDDDEDDAH